MNEFIDYFLNRLQTKKDDAKLTIHKYKADLNKLFEYLKIANINEIDK
jgi:site-specific recombinase XerD